MKRLTEKKAICVQCGAVFNLVRSKISGSYNLRKTCSNDCRNEIIRTVTAVSNTIHETPNDFCRRECIVCGVTFIAAKRQIVRNKIRYSARKTCSPECATELHRKEMSIRYVVGVKKAHAPDVVHALAVARFEKPSTSPAAMLGPTNHASKKCFLVSPDGNEYEFRGLRAFVRDNELLFDEVDVAWKPNPQPMKKLAPNGVHKQSTATGWLNCRAYHGLASVCRGRSRSWKGWTGSYIKEIT